MKSLYCTVTCKSPRGEINAYEGYEYIIVEEDDISYTIVDERGIKESLTKEPDHKGLSYASWFELVE